MSFSYGFLHKKSKYRPPPKLHIQDVPAPDFDLRARTLHRGFDQFDQAGKLWIRLLRYCLKPLLLAAMVNRISQNRFRIWDSICAVPIVTTTREASTQCFAEACHLAVGGPRWDWFSVRRYCRQLAPVANEWPFYNQV